MKKQSRGAKAPVSPYANGRNNLLLMLVFTVVNFVLTLVESDTYFLFSATMPQISLYWGQAFREEGYPELFTVSIVVGVVIIALYLLCWIFSKRHKGWMIAAAVLFALDSVLLVGMYYSILSEIVLDLLFHVWVLVYLVWACWKGKVHDEVPAVPPAAPTQTAYDPGYAEGNFVAPVPTQPQNPAYPYPPSDQTVYVNGEPTDLSE